MDGFVLGPIGHREYPKGPGAINPHPIMRKHFNLFANVRPTRSYPDIGCLRDDVDRSIAGLPGVAVLVVAVLLLFVLSGVFAQGARMRADLEGTV